jgi:CBS domain containing-hemolysin-like protein
VVVCGVGQLCGVAMFGIRVVDEESPGERSALLALLAIGIASISAFLTWKMRAFVKQPPDTKRTPTQPHSVVWSALALLAVFIVFVVSVLVIFVFGVKVSARWCRTGSLTHAAALHGCCCRRCAQMPYKPSVRVIAMFIIATLCNLGAVSPLASLLFR